MVMFLVFSFFLVVSRTFLVLLIGFWVIWIFGVWVRSFAGLLRSASLRG